MSGWAGSKSNPGSARHQQAQARDVLGRIPAPRHRSSDFRPSPDQPPIIDLARQLWGEPNERLSTRDDVRFGAKGSKSVNTGANTWFDHEAEKGGGYVDLLRMVEGEPQPQHRSNGNGTKPGVHAPRRRPISDDIETTYDYRDADQNLILQVIRTISGSPRFMQRRPDGKGGWIWETRSIPEADRPLYRLPGLQASGEASIWVCEGEKDADRLHDEGLIATCNVGGAGKWRTEYAQEFHGKHVVVLPDNDDAGRDHAATVARSLDGIAASVRVLLLPGLPPKGDVSDWLDQDHDIQELERLAREAPEYSRSAPAQADLRASSLPFKWGTALNRVLDSRDFVEGLLTDGCLAVVYGDSNTGKTFWCIDLALHVAGGIPWNGRDVEQGIVLYVSLEGGNVENRIIAARERLGLPPTVPIALVQCPLDLRTNSVDAERLVNTVKLAMSELTGAMPVRLVIIDTLSRALNGGSEDAEGLSALLANADRIRADSKAALLFVAHCGKDAAKGIRGWSGVRAAIDVEIEITRLADETGFAAEVTKERDLPIGDRFGFTLDVVELGINPRGKTVTTCVVTPAKATGPSRSVRTASGPGRPGKQSTLARGFLADLLVTTGEKGHADVPPGLPSVGIESWKVAFFDRSGADPEDRKAFWRVQQDLIGAGIVAKAGDRVWLTHPEKEGL